MSLELSIQETCAQLLHSRPTERKKSADNLKQFLSGNAAASLLTENTLKKRGVRWDDVFTDLNEYVLKELEKYETSKTFDSQIKPMASTLLNMVVAGSNKGKAYINCELVINSCLYILRNRLFTKAIGDTYLNLLYKNVLSQEHYVGYLTPQLWQDLLDVCIDACNSKHTNLDYLTRLKLALLIMQKGSSSCRFVDALRDVLPKIISHYNSSVTDKKVQEVLVEIANVLLKNLSTEYRLTMCEFTESIIPSIIQFYDQNASVQKKGRLFHAIMLAVTLHHPKAKFNNQEGSLSYNYDKWNGIMNNILELVYVESSALQKTIDSKFRVKQSLSDCINYVRLAAIVYYLNFNMSMEKENDKPETSNSKRQRVRYNENKCLADLIDEFRQNNIPWLGVIKYYVEMFGKTVTSKEYLSLLVTIEKRLTSNKDEFICDMMGKLSCMVINNLMTQDWNPEESLPTLLLFWNSCVRQSSIQDCAHSSLHKILQCLLVHNILDVTSVQSLMKLYTELAMPVTNSSIKTLAHILNTNFSKYSNNIHRNNCIKWFTENEIKCTDSKYVEDLLLRFISNENFDVIKDIPVTESLYEILFDSTEKCILFSDFHTEIHLCEKIICTKNKIADVNKDAVEQLNRILTNNLVIISSKVNEKQLNIIQYVNFLKIILSYTNVLDEQTNLNVENELELFKTMKNSIGDLFLRVTEELDKVSGRLELLKCILEFLTTEYSHKLCKIIRSYIPPDFFHLINKFINVSRTDDNDDMQIECDNLDVYDERHYCILILAAYCKSDIRFRNDILNRVFHDDLFIFSKAEDLKCAFECISYLTGKNVEKPPLESVFIFIQSMCKDVVRNSEASGALLKLLLSIIDTIWSECPSTTRDNCCIMVSGYLQRCEREYFAPKVAALVYQCASKVESLNIQHVFPPRRSYQDVLLASVKGKSHPLRLFCSYLLPTVSTKFNHCDIQSLNTDYQDLFVINISDDKELVIKDESANRTLTFLHAFSALAKSNTRLIKSTLLAITNTYKQKSLNAKVVKKVLNNITEEVAQTGINDFWKQDILGFLYFWFMSKYKLEELPVVLLGYSNLEAFIENNIKWMIPSEVLWSCDGNIASSTVLQMLKRTGNRTEIDIIETCFCYIISLCLPYEVKTKYNLDTSGERQLEYARLSKNANKMYNQAKEMLGVDKWSLMFGENMGELVLLTAMHLADNVKAKSTFGLKIPPPLESYFYPEDVYMALLRFFGEMIEGNIMRYLCEHQPLAISKILVKLWQNVFQKNLIEQKCLSMYTYLTFIKSIPLGFSTDAFVYNYSCNSILNVIDSSKDKGELTLYSEALRLILIHFMPTKKTELKDVLMKIMSILVIKKDLGFEDECESLYQYLYSNTDETDNVEILSQNTQQSTCVNAEQFIRNLNSYANNLANPSFGTLNKFRDFLKRHKNILNRLWHKLNLKGFSEECKTSTLHITINVLTEIMTNGIDNKTRVEASNCLAEIGMYDLKTLVMSAPPDSKVILDMKPTQYFTMKVMTMLKGVLFDDSPTIVSQVMLTLARLFKYREGKVAYDLVVSDLDILKPFLPLNSDYAFAKFQLNVYKFDANKRYDFWVPTDDETSAQWVIRITTMYLDVMANPANYLTSLHSVCKIKPNLCRSILPSIVGLVLHFANESQVDTIAIQIKCFLDNLWNNTFDGICEQNSGDETRRGNITYDYKVIIQDVLHVIDFVRLQRDHYTKRYEEFESFNYLRLNYQKVAWAATVADNHLCAVYYGELWCSAQNNGVPPNSPESTLKLTSGEHIQSIFRKCFTSIGEIDAIDGCGSSHLTSDEERRKHLINTKQYADSLLSHDIALSYNECSDNAQLQYGVVKSLHKSGMHHLALQYMKSLPENEKFDDIKFDCLSQLGNWTVFVDTQALVEKCNKEDTNVLSTLKGLRYSCLKDCLNSQVATQYFQEKLDKTLCDAKVVISKLCQKLNMDNCQNVYTVLTNVHLFNDLEDYMSVRCDRVNLKEMVGKWSVDKIPPYQDFKHIEPLITQRCLILEHAIKTYGETTTDMAKLQLGYAELALSNQRIQVSERILAIAKKCSKSKEVSFVEGLISWSKGYKDISLSLLRDIIFGKVDDVKLTASTLRQYGTWMAESRSDNPRNIIEKYLKRSLEVLGRSDHTELRSKIYLDIAKYADSEYKQVVTYMKSSIFENKVKCVEQMKGTALSLRSTQNTLNKDERKALITNERLSKLDETEINSTVEEKKRFLDLALRYYLLSLQRGEESNLSVFRVISLWLENPHFEFGDGIPLSDLLENVPSYKYLPVIPQLAPRLTTINDSFSTKLNSIIIRCAKDHPHHTLPIIFGLKNSEKDKVILNASASSSSRSQINKTEEPRVIAARNIIQQLQADDKALLHVISQMERVCDALISFANYESRSKEETQAVPKSEPINKLGKLDAIPIPTITLAVRKDCNYTNFPSIVLFNDKFEFVGGINCPKKMLCRGSDGKNRTLLIKGQDDLRQDAVMQQVFSIVNTLLKVDPVTSSNKLSIRTYKVVALSRRSGVLEWCEGTMPIGGYLVGTRNQLGAHKRYRPKDISCSAARAKMSMAHDKGESNAQKLANFLKILREFKPVFHYFFTEHYLDPVTWYERRLAYTKSVATSSMVGYVLGIGDRHVQNILIDKVSAEVVHIDFGISFDQGKALTTPEMIPFRLTQDIIAGFGPSGVDGVFRRSCEHTMQLLRDNQEALLTILEVLLCDPLYSWSITPAEAKRKQNLMATPKDTAVAVCASGLAERALVSLESKLRGADGGQVSADALVATLLAQAMDPNRLSRLYPGWQPYL